MARLDYAQARVEMSGIPRGVGAPPPPGMDPKRGKLMCIKVRMLDDTVAVFHLGHKALGQQLLDEVARHLNLLENDYFGLEFIDNMRNRCWLEKDKPILKQIAEANNDAKFYFIVKFYTPNPVDLEEEYTRYLFSLQIRRDLSLGELHCTESTAALLAAYLVQSECGDFSPEDYPDATYLSHSRFVPSQTLEFQQKVMDNHKNLVGMTPGESDLALLEVARRCDFYGVKFHPAKDIEGTEANLSVMHLGIKVFHQLLCVSTFSWAKIRKLSFKRRKLLIKLHPDSYQYYKETIEFVFETRNECKNFWKKCVEHHAFFRCASVESSKKDGKLFSKGSSFRYCGRTQKQLIDYVREHHKRREPFTRPLRSSAPSRTTYATFGDRHKNGRTHASMPHLPHPSQPLDARGARRTSPGCTSDAESRETHHRHKHHAPSASAEMSLSLPNVLADDVHVVCTELHVDPLKSTSGEHIVDNDDQISEDSYRLSDNERSERSTRSDVSNKQLFNTTFTAKRVGNVVVKRVVSQSKSNPTTDDDELSGYSDISSRKKMKEYPFHSRNMVPIEIDGPNVDLSQRCSSTSTGTTVIEKPTSISVAYAASERVERPTYTPSGTLLRKPRVISTDDETYVNFQKNSPDPIYTTFVSSLSSNRTDEPSPPKVIVSARPSTSSTGTPDTYGATGPLPGKILTKENICITPEGVRPIVPPKPKVPPHAKTPEATHDSTPATPRSASEPREVQKPTRPALISVSSEDRPDIEKCHLFNSDIPYTLTMRKVDPAAFPEGQTNSLGRATSRSPENFRRRKSLDLVPRKRLPSPGNFSSQDHSIEPLTPEGDVLEYVLRRRSMSHERPRRRTDPRRQTQPVRFDLPPSPNLITSGSTPLINFDDVNCESIATESLHEDMDRLEKSTTSLKEDSEDEPLPPPPPPSTLRKPAKAPPPPPPPKPKDIADRVVEIKASTVMNLTKEPDDSPPFIDDSPKSTKQEMNEPTSSKRTESGLLVTDF